MDVCLDVATGEGSPSIFWDMYFDSTEPAMEYVFNLCLLNNNDLQLFTVAVPSQRSSNVIPYMT